MNQLQKQQTRSITFKANGDDVTLSPSIVRDYLVRGNSKEVTGQEIAMFLNLCKFQHLNPFLNEAFIVKFGDKPAQLITSKEAFMKRAESHPQYNGLKAGETERRIHARHGSYRSSRRKLRAQLL